MKRAVVLVLLMAAPASARGWREERSEWAADLEYARHLDRLGCAELNAAAEWQRQVANQQIYASYHRWQTTPTAPAARVGSLRPVRPGR